MVTKWYRIVIIIVALLMLPILYAIWCFVFTKDPTTWMVLEVGIGIFELAITEAIVFAESPILDKISEWFYKE